jgi:hypothetical protein
LLNTIHCDKSMYAGGEFPKSTEIWESLQSK